jgi:hypothetical protein
LTLRGKGIVGGIIAAVGAIVIVLGLYRVITSDFVAANIPSIVGNGFAYILYGAVVFIVGVVVVNFRNPIALVIHLAAVVPYYFAIQAVIEVGQAGATTVGAYWSASSIPWILGVALNLIGIIVNRVVKVKRVEKAPAAPADAATPPEPPSAP